MRARGRIGSNPDRPVFFSLFGCIAGKVPCHSIIRTPVLRHQIQRNHGKLRRSAALQKQHRMRIRNGKRADKLLLRILKNLCILRAAVTHLHHGQAGTVIIHQLRLCALQHGLGHDRGTGREIINLISVQCQHLPIHSDVKHTLIPNHDSFYKILTLKSKHVKP